MFLFLAAQIEKTKQNRNNQGIAKRCASHFIINVKHRETSCVLYCVAKLIYEFKSLRKTFS